MQNEEKRRQSMTYHATIKFFSKFESRERIKASNNGTFNMGKYGIVLMDDFIETERLIALPEAESEISRFTGLKAKIEEKWKARKTG